MLVSGPGIRAMKKMPLSQAFTLMEPGPVVLVTTNDGRKSNIIVLEGVAAYFDRARKEKRTLHAVGDGTFVADGRKLNRR